MQHPARRSTILAAAILVAFAIAACSSPAGAAPGSITPTVSEAEATEMATNAFEALNDGDYAAWSRDWSASMKAAIKESDFLAFRQSVLDQLGAYEAIEKVELTSVKPGTYRYVFTLSFENGTGVIGLGFADGSDEVVGVHVG